MRSRGGRSKRDRGGRSRPARAAQRPRAADPAAPERAIRIRVLDYDADRLVERELEQPEACARFRASPSTTWIDVEGVHDHERIAAFGRVFDIHPLTVEDIVHPHQRPKMEEYPGYLYVALRMMHYDHESSTLEPEQVSLVFGKGFLLSFQESIEGDLFDPVRKRLREGRARIRGAGSDYLAYALLDVVIDRYMDVLEGLGEHMEELEDALTSEPSQESMHRIVELRRRTILLRRSLWPLREVVSGLQRSNASIIAPETQLYLRDAYDHTVRTAEMIESAREVLASLAELQVSMVAFRLNEIMKILAIIGTFFLPLTFIAGVYGMNFDPRRSPLNMPELHWYYGYPFALALMAAVAGGMFLYFRRRGWL